MIRFWVPCSPGKESSNGAKSSLINGSAMGDTAADPCQVKSNIYSVSNHFYPKGLGPGPKYFSYLWSLYVPATVDAKFGMAPYRDMKNFGVNPTPGKGTGPANPTFWNMQYFHANTVESRATKFVTITYQDQTMDMHGTPHLQPKCFYSCSISIPTVCSKFYYICQVNWKQPFVFLWGYLFLGVVLGDFIRDLPSIVGFSCCICNLLLRYFLAWT